MKRLLCSILILAGCEPSPGPPSAPGGVATHEEGFFSSTGVDLSYALDLPAGPGPFGGVVMGHGSGPVTKDEGLAFVRFWVDRGFAVLRYDKRGVGQSMGVYRGLSARNSEDVVPELAGDMLAGVEFLRGRPSIDRDRVGLMGVSQAGWIMAEAASRSAEVRFFVAVVGSVIPVGNNVAYENLRGLPIDEAYAELPGYSGPSGYDPLPALRTAGASGIWLLGEVDRLVPTRLCRPLLEQLRAEGYPYSLHTYAGRGHELSGTTLFWADLAGWLSAEGL